MVPCQFLHVNVVLQGGHLLQRRQRAHQHWVVLVQTRRVLQEFRHQHWVPHVALAGHDQIGQPVSFSKEREGDEYNQTVL